MAATSPTPSDPPASPSPAGTTRLGYLQLIRGDRQGVWPTFARFGLYLASIPYGWAIRVRNLAYSRAWMKSQRVEVPVISVGNLTVGGTGKTPCVEFIANFYRQQGWRVCILSRGYGGAGERNDEARILEENLPDVPHLQGADRVRWAWAAIEELESELLVLDDGFQHRRLARDLDVVLIDATNPWGHGHLLPRGLLREPRSSLHRAHVVVLTRCDQVSEQQRQTLHAEITRLAPDRPRIDTIHRPVHLINSEGSTISLEQLSKNPVVAFCGIGNPGGFRRTLQDQGAEILGFRVYQDHHAYTRADVEELSRWLGAFPTTVQVITTQKDLVKLRVTQLAGRPLWALRIQLQVEAGQDLLEQHLQAVLPAG